jgi:hypothetical protein
MQLHLASTTDGFMLWGVFLDGTHNDGDGGIDIHESWFVVARTEQDVRTAVGPKVDAQKSRYRWNNDGPSVVYRPVTGSELVICERRPGGRLNAVTLADGTAIGFSVTPALMDARG